MSQLVIPHINNNDTHAMLVEWCVDDGVEVARGDVVAILETSKSTFELEAQAEGRLRIEKEAGDEYAFGDRIGSIGEAEPGSESASPEVQESARDLSGDLIITQGAQRLIAEAGLSREALVSVRKRIIRERDVRALLGQPEASQALAKPDVDDVDNVAGVEENGQQSAVARVVTRSHREIPAAFLLKRVYVKNALKFAKDQSQALGKMISLSDLVVSRVGKLRESFPRFFGQVDSRGRLHEMTSANVGVTFDFGKGLFIPVIALANERPLAEIAGTMMRYRMKAMRGRFDESDLSGGAISISLNMEPDTEFVRPLILPSQVCMISVNAIFSEWVPEDDGSATKRDYLRLGITYDHRFINGYDSQQFATALKEQIEEIGGD